MSPKPPWKTRPVRSERFALIVSLVLIAGCARDDQLSSPLVSNPLSSSTSLESTTTSTSSTTSSTSTTSTVVAATEPPPVTTAPAPATDAPTTVASTTTTLVPGACAALLPIPPGAVESASKLIDVDADGVTDTVRTYSIDDTPTSGDWHVRVELAAGGGSDIWVPDDPAPGSVKVLGGTYVGSSVEPGPEGPRPAIFVVVGAGASTSLISLMRLNGCLLEVMGNATFALGAGVNHAAALRCEGVAGTSLLVEQATELNRDGVTFDVTDTAYTRSGIDLVVYGSGPITTNQPSIPVMSNLIDCSGVDDP